MDIGDGGGGGGSGSGGGSSGIVEIFSILFTVFSGLQVAPEYKPHPPIFA